MRFIFVVVLALACLSLALAQRPTSKAPTRKGQQRATPARNTAGKPNNNQKRSSPRPNAIRNPVKSTPRSRTTPARVNTLPLVDQIYKPAVMPPNWSSSSGFDGGMFGGQYRKFDGCSCQCPENGGNGNSGFVPGQMSRPMFPSPPSSPDMLVDPASGFGPTGMFTIQTVSPDTYPNY